MNILPSRDRDYLLERKIAFEEVAGPPKAVILRGYPLPAGRFDQAKADLLVVLPESYPLTHPDMFFAQPWLKLVNGNKYPKAADQPYPFMGTTWQQWSRHNNQWRPGLDGIWTMLRRIDTALEVAA